MRIYNLKVDISIQSRKIWHIIQHWVIISQKPQIFFELRPNYVFLLSWENFFLNFIQKACFQRFSDHKYLGMSNLTNINHIMYCKFITTNIYLINWYDQVLTIYEMNEWIFKDFWGSLCKIYTLNIHSSKFLNFRNHFSTTRHNCVR